MTAPTHEEIALRLKAAEHELADAEGELQRLIGALEVLPRAEKVTISASVYEAFAKLKSAHARIAALEKVLLPEG